MTIEREVLDSIVDDPDAVFLFDPVKRIYDTVSSTVTTVVVSVENEFDADQFISLPVKFHDPGELFRFGISGGLDRGFIADGNTVLCAGRLFGRSFDSVTRVTVDATDESAFYDFFARSRADQSVLNAVLELAIGLGKSGQKGNSVGALFAVGNAGTVMSSSRSLSYNPFDQSHVQVGDPIVGVMLKEFSRLDGAFVISDAGKVVSAYRYLEPAIEGIDIPKGLGTRHNAAAAITDETEAVTIVLSESDSRVRGFKNGQLVFNLDPELY